MKKEIVGLYLRTRALARSVRQVNRVHLMDEVIYNGKKCFVNNGVSAPVWDLCEKEWNLDGTRNTYRVHENNFKKIRSYRNLKNDLLHNYDWYMLYWYKIDLRKFCAK